VLAGRSGNCARVWLPADDMEITVVTASNVPPKPIIAVHAGGVRRQMKLEVNHPFVLPKSGALVEVSVFQQLASQLLPEDGKQESKCTIPVRTPDGTATQVQLEIRRDAALQDKPKDGQSIQDYLETHKVQQRIQHLIQEVLREAPEDPYKFMLQQLREIQATTPKRGSRPQEVLLPQPPDKPKPPGSRPAPAPGRSIVTPKVQVDKSAWKASRHVLRSVLESPRCRKVGEESVVHGVCHKAAQGMTKCIMDLACLQVVNEVSGRNEVRAVASTVVKATLASASRMIYLQKSGILAKLAIRLALVGAIDRLGSDEYPGCVDQYHPDDLAAVTAASFWEEWLAGMEAGEKDIANGH
ncbi:unnamed protein product, partial [Durusdinium trenchii]